MNVQIPMPFISSITWLVFWKSTQYVEEQEIEQTY